MQRSPEHSLNRSNINADWHDFLGRSSEPAYKRIYLYYHHRLSALGVKKGFDIELVHDAINELFLYLWENAERLTHINNHESYLTASFLRKLYKSNGPQVELVEEMTEFPESLVVPSVETVHIYNDLSDKFTKKVAKVVDGLPERQRLLIYQRFYLGLSYIEIANSNQISINTVYNTIYKAIASLKDQLDDDILWVLPLVSSMIYFFSLFFKL